MLAVAWQVEKEVNGGRWLKEKVEARNEQAIEAILASKGQTTTIAADGQPTPLHNSEQMDNQEDEEEAVEESDDSEVNGNSSHQQRRKTTTASGKNRKRTLQMTERADGSPRTTSTNKLTSPPNNS